MRVSIWFVALLFAGTIWSSDVARGQIFYAHLLHKDLGYNGTVFTKLYTEAQWQALFQSESEGFRQIFAPKLSEETNAVLASEHFQERIAPHLEAFVRHYAKDRPAVPVCMNDEGP